MGGCASKKCEGAGSAVVEREAERVRTGSSNCSDVQPQRAGAPVLTLAEAETESLDAAASAAADASSREAADDCGVGFVGPDATEQAGGTDATTSGGFGASGSDDLAVLLGVAVIFQNTVCVADSQLPIVCGVFATLIGIGTICAQLFHTFVLGSVSRTAAAHASAQIRLDLQREEANRAHEARCNELRDAMEELEDNIPLHDQQEAWQRVVQLIERLESSWRSLREAVHRAEPTTVASHRRWTAVRKLSKQRRTVQHSLRSVFDAVQAHPLTRVGESEKRESLLSEQRRSILSTVSSDASAASASDVSSLDLDPVQFVPELPLRATMSKLGGGTRGLKAIRSAWHVRTFVLSKDCLEWGAASSMASTKVARHEEQGGVEDADTHVHSKLKACDMASVDEWSGSLGAVQVQHGLQLCTTTKGHKIYYIETASKEQQEEWCQALRYVMETSRSVDKSEADLSYEFTCECIPRGLEIGGHRAAEFVLQGSHGKVMVRMALERARLDFDPSGGQLQLYPGLQIRVRGTALGLKLPPAPKVPRYRLTNEHRQKALSTFLLKKQMDELDLQTSNWLSEEAVRAVAEEVARYQKEIQERSVKDRISLNEAYRKLCKRLAYLTPDGTSVDPESLYSLILRREQATWHDPRDITVWGRLSCLVGLDGSLHGADETSPGGTDKTSSLNSASSHSSSLLTPSTQGEMTQLMSRLRDDPMVCVCHRLTNHTPHRLTRRLDEPEEFLGAGTWFESGPPEAIEAGATVGWGSCNSVGYYSRLLSGTSATFVYRAGMRSVPSEAATGAGLGYILSKQSSLVSDSDGNSAGCDAFDLILTHNCPATTVTHTVRLSDNQAAGVIEDLRPEPYSANLVQEQHRTAIRQFDKLGNHSTSDLNNVEISVKISVDTESDKKKDTAPLLVINWTLTQRKFGTEGKHALQTAGAMASPSQHTSTWLLDELLPATQGEREAAGMMAQLSKDYWVETFAATVFDKAGLPRGAESGWLQVQVAPADSFGLGLRPEWLDVPLNVQTHAAAVGGSVLKYAPTDDLLLLCIDEFKRRFAETGNWREKLTEAMDDHAPDEAAAHAKASLAAAAAFGEELVVPPSYDQASLSVTPRGAVRIPQTVGQAQVHGAESATEGLMQGLEWRAIAWIQSKKAQFEVMQTMDPSEIQKCKQARLAVAGQWLSARTPAEITAAKQLKVTPKLMRTMPQPQQFDQQAALADRKRWDHWEQAKTADVLGWVMDEYVDNILLAKWTLSLKRAVKHAVDSRISHLNEGSAMVFAVHATLLSDGRREQLLAYSGSVAQRVVASLAQNAAAAMDLGLSSSPADVGFFSFASSSPLVAGAYDAVSNWWWQDSAATSIDAFKIDSHTQRGIVTMLALGLAVGRAEHESKLLHPATYRSTHTNRFGRRYYVVCRRLLLVSSVAVQIKCYTNLADYIASFIATICLVTVYYHVRRVISAVIFIWILVQSWQYVNNELLPTVLLDDDVRQYDAEHLRQYDGVPGSLAARPLLLLAYAAVDSVSSLGRRSGHQLLQLDDLVLHVVLIAMLEVAIARRGRVQSSWASLGGRVCIQLVQCWAVSSALVWCDHHLLESSHAIGLLLGVLRPPLGDRTPTESLTQRLASGVLVAVGVRAAGKAFGLFAKFAVAALSSWRQITHSSTALVFLVLVAKSMHHIEPLLREALAPLPVGQEMTSSSGGGDGWAP